MRNGHWRIWYHLLQGGPRAAQVLCTSPRTVGAPWSRGFSLRNCSTCIYLHSEQPTSQANVSGRLVSISLSYQLMKLVFKHMTRQRCERISRLLYSGALRAGLRTQWLCVGSVAEAFRHTWHTGAASPGLLPIFSHCFPVGTRPLPFPLPRSAQSLF